MRNRIRRLATPAVLTLAALGLSGTALLAAAGAASASTPVTGTTSMTNVPDTTGGASGGACGTSANGPTWATDNYTATLSAVADSTPPNTYDVTITVNGSFVGFADPNTCQPLQSTGSLTGTIEYEVTSPNAPSASGLKSDYNGATEFSTVIDDFFGDSPLTVITGGNDYNFSYQGGNFVENTAGQTGDVQATPCAVTVSPIASQTSQLNTAIRGLQVDATSNYPGTLQFGAKNLPKGLSMDAAGKITGTPIRTGTDVVTVSAINPTYSTAAAQCDAATTFNWTVSLTASSQSASSSGSSGSSSASYPTGGVQTGGGKPAGDPVLPFGIGLAGLAVVAFGTAGAFALRRQHQGR
jgi:hypothetical protein